MPHILEDIFESILNGQQKVAVEKVTQALAEGIEPGAILNDGMVAAMAEVGRLFEEGEYFVPEMLIAARAMQSGLAVLKPHLVQANVKPHRQGRGRHGQGRPARHRQEPGVHDAGRRRLRDRRPGRRTWRRRSSWKRSREHGPQRDLHVGPADHHHAEHEEHHRGAQGSRGARPGQGHGRRRAGDRAAIADEIGADGYAPDASRAVALRGRWSGCVEFHH